VFEPKPVHGAPVRDTLSHDPRLMVGECLPVAAPEGGERRVDRTDDRAALRVLRIEDIRRDAIVEAHHQMEAPEAAVDPELEPIVQRGAAPGAQVDIDDARRDDGDDMHHRAVADRRQGSVDDPRAAALGHDQSHRHRGCRDRRHEHDAGGPSSKDPAAGRLLRHGDRVRDRQELRLVGEQLEQLHVAHSHGPTPSCSSASRTSSSARTNRIFAASGLKPSCVPISANRAPRSNFRTTT